MPTHITTQNPYTNTKLKTYDYFSTEIIKDKLENANTTFNFWKKQPIAERTKLLDNLAQQLSNDIDTYSRLISLEMGKPISESYSEIEKCIALCEFYSKNAELLLSDEMIKSDAQESFISYDPLGCVLGIMPWNFPFWQAFRFAVPTVTAGNTVLLKHASNVTGCAVAIESIFEAAGYPTGRFTTLLTDHDTIEHIIKNDIVKAVSLTGSEKAGKAIAKIAGGVLKPTVLELGGNNGCMVLADADLDTYMDTMVQARMQNTGQSCIAAKRFIVEDAIYDAFLEKFTAKVDALSSGNPLLKNTEIGVMARKDLADTLEEQIDSSIKLGAKVHFGNTRKDNYYQPTILTHVTPQMPIFTEETFGPVAAVIKVANKEEAYKMVSDTKFGLGTMLFTKDTEDAKHRIIDIEDGAFFINEMVKSSPELPFGGTKASGYGRELSREGILAFTNKKTVYIK
jgi:succinate-semialdehyde dehydrogenase/glutarate-semialdehyde dehydrogenase